MTAQGKTWLLAGLSLFAALLCIGCSARLVGLHDVDARFTFATVSPEPSDLRDRLEERLLAAELTADIDLNIPGEARLRMDDEFADEVSRLVTWPGGVTLVPVDKGVVNGQPAPKGTSVVTKVPSESTTHSGTKVTIPLLPNALAALANVTPGARLAVVRDRTVIGILGESASLDGANLVLSLGSGIRAYSDAEALARLLGTPELPTMTRASVTPVPADRLLASANVLLPLLTSLGWLFFVRRFDRAQPEPMWLVATTFVLGAVMVVPAGVIEWGWDVASPYTNATLLTFGRAPWAFPIALVGFVVTVGLTEEGAKLLATRALATRRREFDEPVDGIVYGGAAALGFAAAENIKYLALGRLAGPLVASRAFMSVPAHLFFGSLWGYALGRRLVHPDKPVWPLFIAAAAAHGLFDTCLSIDGGGLWATLVGFLVASLFIVHLRLALRHGAVPKEGATATQPERVELFRVGSRTAFGGFVALTYLFAGGLFVLAMIGHEGRVSVPFALSSAALLALLGWSARGIAATLPLDVVVGDASVTFAGASIPYTDVVRIERSRIVGSPRKQERVVVVGRARQLVLGPADKPTVDALAATLARRLRASVPG